ncbi:transcriptional regulator [Melghirimyces algeriensis]|uniref:Uncharacterized conserved protein HemY, contains two TPR repeats n=1 Tax=Melghirimyces algeriensis TaxID=910412 RepID=A0A521E1M6_9BACL|nr:transcriptional regulator [Melghirimyces algeriensis]SMO77211.1 Uncharacterized conserved protein HemY, contains two TPR repeats [Melghirimyces algeriensis]
MPGLGINEMGEMIRKIRKEKGLRLEDLADEHISTATISNIERGIPYVHQERAFYLLKKLEIDMERLPELVMGEQQKTDDLRRYFAMVETIRQTGDIDEALRRLNQLSMADSHPMTPTLYYLKGRCFFSDNDWDQAKQSLYRAIQLAGQHSPQTVCNIASASYVELGCISYYENNLNEALKYTDQGLNTFVPDGERPHLWFIIHRNKAVYLERLGRIGESLAIIEQMWTKLSDIDDMESLLTCYWLRSELLRKHKVYDLATQYAMEGLDLAQRNKQYDYMFDLWTVLGSVFMSKREIDRAQSCFDTALKLKEKLTDRTSITTIYLRLGSLYLSQQQFLKASEVLQRATQSAQDCNDIPRLCTAFMLNGDQYRLQDRFDEAIPFYQKTLALAGKHGYRKREYWASYRLAQCYDGRDEQAFQKSLQTMYYTQLEWKKEKGEEMSMLL